MNSAEKPYSASRKNDAVALTRDGADIGVAQSRRRLDERIEHRLQVEGRAADDLQHLGRRRLLLQRLGELGGARLHFLEQARILDRDDGLVGEGLEDARSASRRTAAPPSGE